ncbi:hypothetical protein HUA74_15370 [Myxococcus sp. CA051A]|uniref:hypothetical protein n=1 Tax=Myxococcus sp. CA051A TaxID=2741739 RepID=UPI00157BA345|nr:hypothetical protein [Myxococcus sp. CA051A]NTX62041.1 hypothetical protein [Myxococcus sp. CA051A]
MSLRRVLPWSLALLLSFTTAVFAEPTATEVLAPESSEPQDAASLVCVAVRCSTVSECWAACPGASSVSCVSNGCRYTLPGGGGGGGGPWCELTRCSDDADCVCKGQQGYCEARACQY